MLVLIPSVDGSMTVVPSKDTEYSARWLASVTVTIVRPSGEEIVSVSELNPKEIKTTAQNEVKNREE